MDGDSDLDILAKMRGDGTRFTVYMNVGGFIFENIQNYFAYSEGVSLGDIDGDGDIDIIYSNYKYAYTLPNQGDGTFANRSTVAMPGSNYNIFDVDLADFDNDGDLDIFATNAYGYDASSYLLLNNDATPGTFTDSGQAIPSGFTLRSFVGDADLDGDIDIVTLSTGGYEGAATPTLWVNDGSGIMELDSELKTLADQYTEILFADLDQDSDQDLMSVGYFVGSRLFLNEAVSTGIPIQEADSLALVALYDATDGDNWTNNTNWAIQGGPSVSEWFGVEIQGDRVKKITLIDNNLTGTLPAEIGDLNALDNLILNVNNLTGPIPSEIGSMIELDTLILSINSLSGNIPDELYNLSNLRRLSISQNELEGTISPNIANLTNLGFIALWDNPLTGTIPEEFWSMTSLQNVYLGTSELEGDISQFTNLTNLVVFWVDESDVTGTISAEVGNLTNLEILDVSDNQMSGALPVELATLANLDSLEIENNEFTDLPDLSGTNLQKLVVNGNLFDFSDIEPNVGIPDFNYAPQNISVPLDISINGNPFFTAVDTVARAGSTVLISVASGLSENNEYQWNFNGNLDDTQTTSEFSIPSIGRADMGVHVLTLTNTVADQLTLTSDPIELLANAVITVSAVDEVEEGDDTPIADIINAYLFSLNEVVADTVEFSGNPNFGISSDSYSFPEVTLGDYLVAVESVEPFLDGEDDQIPGAYIPSFFGDAFLSRDADTLSLESDSAIQIVVEKIPEVPMGEGLVVGTIDEDFPDEDSRIDARRRAKKRKCGLRRRRTGGRIDQDPSEFELIAYGETNDNGEFEYGFLPMGTYQFFVEYPGIPLDESAFVEFEIGEAGVTDDEFTLAVFASPDGIEIEIVLGITSDYFSDVKVYPNPTSDLIVVEYAEIRDNDTFMEIMTLDGKTIHSQKLERSSGKVQYDASLLKSGQYLLRFRNGSGKEHLVYRMIKK